jgi:hypothetical protein
MKLSALINFKMRVTLQEREFEQGFFFPWANFSSQRPGSWLGR